MKMDRQYRDNRCLLYSQNFIAAHKKYLQEYCEQDEINEIMNIQKYYQQRTRTKHGKVDMSGTVEHTQFDNFEKQMNKIEQLFVKQAHNSNDFWNVECDSAYNFKYYFNNFNPINLMAQRITSTKKSGRQRDTIFMPTSTLF